MPCALRKQRYRNHQDSFVKCYAFNVHWTLDFLMTSLLYSPPFTEPQLLLQILQLPAAAVHGFSLSC